MTKNGCELCTKTARMFCESDQASLCWDCDEKVHTANFLVAKHSRTLLCNVCHSTTPWKASGLNIGPTVSLCHGCAVGRVENRGRATTPSNRREDEGGSDSQESESDDGEYCSDSEGSSEDKVNQVVPWSDSGSNSPQPKPPPPQPGMEGSRCCGSEANASISSSSKRRRGENNFESEDEDVCCSSRNLDLNLQWDENCSSSSSTKRHQSEEHALLPSSSSSTVVEKLRRFGQKIIIEEKEASAMIRRD